MYYVLSITHLLLQYVLRLRRPGLRVRTKTYQFQKAAYPYVYGVPFCGKFDTMLLLVVGYL